MKRAYSLLSRSVVVLMMMMLKLLMPRKFLHSELVVVKMVLKERLTWWEVRDHIQRLCLLFCSVLLSGPLSSARQYSLLP